MNILILNWRDIKNPSGGGAEILTHEMAKRWVKTGHKVKQISSSFLNAKVEEEIDGVTLIRKGKWWTVHIHAFLYYLRNRNEIDIIIDEVHWFPFFAAVYAPRKTIALTCEVASKLLFKIFPYPVALFFLLIEKFYLLIYKNVPTMVISPSTKDDLVATGHNKENIVVLPMGVTIPTGIKVHNKERKPTLVSVGRLNKQKGTLDVIEAFKLINKSIPESKLWLIGSGDVAFKKIVEDKIKEYNLDKKVKLWGFVSEEEKFALLSRAHILVSASVQEGWGLTLPEAAYVKTPSVVYNILGFRDVIAHNKTGILVDANPNDLAEQVIKLVKNKSKYDKLQENAYEAAKLSTWEKTANVSLNFIRKQTAK